MIPALRARFNREFSPDRYSRLLKSVQERTRCPIGFRLAETPIFVPAPLLNEMAQAGIQLAKQLVCNQGYLEAARSAIPVAFRVPAETPHPHFLTADFALIRGESGKLVPRLVEIQAFPSIYALQAALGCAYREAYGIDKSLGRFLGGLDDAGFWKLMSKTILGRSDPENVVLTEVDPQHQKTRPDFEITARKLGLTVVDITRLEGLRDRLHYRNAMGTLVPIRRIYNRAIADEIMARNIRIPVDLTRRWNVEWAGHPDWYFLISKFSLPWLTRADRPNPVVPPAVFLDEFLAGEGRARLQHAGVDMPKAVSSEAVYHDLLLKPLFSFAGKGIRFDPSQAELEAIPAERRHDYLLQKRMDFVANIETPCGPTQAEIRILYLWPDDGTLTAVLPLVRLGRGKMMGVDHNRDQEWVGASAAFIQN